MPVGEVYLVGAGCGRADLITVRGLRLLERCDAVVYDDLIDPALLEYVPAGAKTIYMGKRSGHHSAPQEEITAALIALAQEGLTVVRLKGGDPFVFGRGGEEMLALKEAGIPCEEVPGISSAIAIPAAAGIPVTHRDCCSSLHIVTGHQRAGKELAIDFEALVRTPPTPPTACPGIWRSWPSWRAPWSSSWAWGGWSRSPVGSWRGDGGGIPLLPSSPGAILPIPPSSGAPWRPSPNGQPGFGLPPSLWWERPPRWT